MNLATLPPNLSGLKSLVAALGSRLEAVEGGSGAAARNPLSYGGVGDGTHDDTDAFQRALDDLLVDEASRGKLAGLYVPPGRWRITSPLSLEGRSFIIYGAGPRLSFIDANFNGYVFVKTGGQPIVDHPTIRDVTILNRGALGGCLQIAGTHELVLQRVYLQGHIGLWRGLPEGVIGDGGFTTGLYDCTFRLSGAYAGSIGMTGHNHILLSGCDANGIETAFQLGGMNVNVIGGRTEVCGTGFLLGVGEQGDNVGWMGTVIGHYFEACDGAIDVRSGKGTIVDTKVYGTINSPSGDSQYGIRLPGFGGPTTVSNCLLVGSFARSPLLVGRPADGGASSVRVPTVAARIVDTVTQNVRATPAKTWDIQQPWSVVLENTNAPADLVAATSRVRRARDVTVPEGATFLDVTFPPAFPTHGAYGASIASATPGAGGSGVLPAGTYTYLGVYVTEAGESFPGTDQGVFGVRTAVVPANGSVTLAFVGASYPGDARYRPAGLWRRRVYRARVPLANDPLRFEGYYDMPLGSDAPCVDTGATLTGLGSPRLGEHAELGWVEADAAYRVRVDPQWGTTTWVTGRTTTGFRINFGTAAPAGALLDWDLVR